MDWTSTYKSRVVTPQEAVQGDQVWEPHLPDRERVRPAEGFGRTGRVRPATQERGNLPGADGWFCRLR